MNKIDLKVLEELKSFSPYRKTNIILSSKEKSQAFGIIQGTISNVLSLENISEYQKKQLKRALDASEELFQSFLNQL